MAEATRACEILKARPLYAGQMNGRAIVDQSHYEAFRKLLEAQRPDVVFTQWPIDNHADHRAISMLTYDAWLKLGKSFALYYYEVPTVRTPFTSRQPTTSTSPRPYRGNARPVTCMPARPPTSSTPFKSWSRGCAGSRAGMSSPKVTFATCRALTSDCPSPDRTRSSRRSVACELIRTGPTVLGSVCRCDLILVAQDAGVGPVLQQPGDKRVVPAICRLMQRCWAATAGP